MTQRIRIKFCGITRVSDAQRAVQLGVDALGFVFYAESSRFITLEQAHEIIMLLPPFISVVGVFVNPTAQQVTQALTQLPLTLLQFHGEEPATFCETFDKPYIKGIRVQAGMDLATVAEQYASSQALLLDSYHPTAKGGSGITFAWELIPPQLPLPIILSGGLTIHNVAAAVRQVQPYAVDVSSGIEAAPGIKSATKMQEFVAALYKGA